MEKSSHDQRWYRNFLNLFGVIYDTLYDNETDGEQYANVVKDGDRLLRDKTFACDLKELVKARGDIFCSDRETAALVLANKIMTL